MKPSAYIKAVSVVLTLLTTVSVAGAKDITVFAAASLRGALDEIATLSSDTVTLSYGGSGLIARQVAQGAPADVVVLAHPVWMDWLDEQMLLAANTRTDVAANSLTVIAMHGTPVTDKEAWLATSKIAMGQRDAVPAGIYAKQWLVSAGLWDTVQPNLIETDNVRLALALVARGDVAAGITYRSDAMSDPRVRIVHDVDPAMHTPIRYPAAAITDQGRAFVSLLSTPKARNIFQAHGFLPVPLN